MEHLHDSILVLEYSTVLLLFILGGHVHVPVLLVHVLVLVGE